MKINSKILIIAGSDSSGGAGIQADIKSVTSLGSYAMTAITAVTAQNTKGIKSVIPIPIKEISNQIEFTSRDIKPDSVKIGMLQSTQVINSVLLSIKKLKLKKIILDPVMVAKSGTKLIDDKAVLDLKKKLINKVDLVTPNIPEAEILTAIKIKSMLDMKNAAYKLLDLGAKNVLIKGGHLNSKNLKDMFVNNKEIEIFTNKKIKTKNTHGTGCTLSSAIATFYGCGKTLKKSCELGIRYVNNAIKTRPNFGKGNGPINHLNSFIIEKKFR